MKEKRDRRLQIVLRQSVAEKLEALSESRSRSMASIIEDGLLALFAENQAELRRAMKQRRKKS
jgi:hypothetical protein